MKTKTQILFISFSLLFFILIMPIQAKALDPGQGNCQCTGPITNITETACTSGVISGLCSWDNNNNRCDCDTGEIIVANETQCTAPSLIETLGMADEMPDGAIPQFDCTFQLYESDPASCSCEALFSSAIVGPQTCAAYDNLPSTNCTKIGTVSGGDFKCHCIYTKTVTNLQCKPETLSEITQFADKRSNFCCTFADGTQTNFTYADGQTATACQDIASALETTGAVDTTGAIITDVPEAEPVGTLQNFLGTTDINVIIGRLVKAVIGIAGSIALAVFIYGGVLWMFSAGNPDKVAKGKNAMMYAAIGLAVIFLSYTLVAFVLKALTQ